MRTPRRSADPRGIPAAEWLAALVGLALVVLCVGSLLREAVWGDASPPDIGVTVDAVVPRTGQYLVRFRAVNRGGTTAAAVIVEGRLRDPSGATETSQALVDYVPEHSEVLGGLFFRADPRRGELSLRATGYQQP